MRALQTNRLLFLRKFTRKSFLLACVVLISFAKSVVAKDDAPVLLPAPKKISPHVYAWIGPLDGPSKKNQGYRMNMAFVVGDNAVAVLETGYTEAMAEAMLKHIRHITHKPIKAAINCNSQPDRFMGNPAFRRAGIKIIAHAESAKRMAKQSANYASNIERILELKAGSIKIPKAPDILITGKHVIELGGVNVILDNYGPAHTPAQLVAYIAQDHVVYSGDLLYGQRLLAINTDGSVSSWISNFDRLKQIDAKIFIPGHGQPGPLSEFEFSTRQYLALLYDHMTKMLDSGVDMQDAINRLNQSAFSKLANFELLAGRNASRTYLEVEAAAFN